jgi:hypothetical protein
MVHLITFVTDRFDPARETPNDINPIAGQAVLLWLRERLQPLGYDTTLPAMEDWGWYVGSDSGASSYLVGASGDPESGPTFTGSSRSTGTVRSRTGCSAATD